MTGSDRMPGRVFAKGLLGENPALRLALGICPALAVTTTAVNGLAMGLATAAVLACTCLAISLMRGMLPEKGRLPVVLAVSAMFATIAHAVLRAHFAEINAALGVYVPLIAVSSLILCRADRFAAENPVPLALLDGLGMGIGYACGLTILGAMRELIGVGSVFGVRVLGAGYEPMLLAAMPAGGFLVYGLLLGIVRALAARGEEASK